MTPTWPAVIMACAAASIACAAPTEVHWLDRVPGAAAGVSFGVPWMQGSVAKGTAFHLSAAGKDLPSQSWDLAYWPDGSVKWTGFAAVAATDLPQGVAIEPGHAPAVPAAAVRVDDIGAAVTVDTGAIRCAFPRSGDSVIAAVEAGGHVVAHGGQLVCDLEGGRSFVGRVERVTVEQPGPIRAVVRVQGHHADGRRSWLPFNLRFYFYAGQASIRVVDTIIFDGDQEKDFIRGLGLHFTVPLHEGPRYRQVRFGGEEGGVWSEPLQPGGGNPDQEAGRDFSPRGNFGDNAIWDDFKLAQPNPEGFTIVKRTNPRSSWLYSVSGARASGFVSVGDRRGGFGISERNFWQSFPASLEVRHAASASADVIAWLWSPDGPPMDMRHYDLKAHTLSASYEDVQPGLSTAYGVARTSELTLYPSAGLPSRVETAAMAAAGQTLPLFVCSPERIHETGVFGVWSLVNRSTPFRKSIEDGLDSVLAFYERQQVEREWYGFWQYGDVMHSYSLPRHDWHYDWGGHAWDNTELGAPLWLWYSFLRSGRADLFRFAEAHTRNTSETDVYHLGPMAGLGSRHNVVKWGDGAKEARISQSAHWRVFYYLTTDERTGDLMRENDRADLSVIRYDPMREAEPPVPGEPVFKARLRIGPDWFALAGNWMTEWERTGDVTWRDRILAGVDSIVQMPYGFETGQLNGLNPDLPGGGIGPLKGGGSMTVGYDPDTGRLFPIRDPLTKGSVPVSYNLATIQGGGEVMFELVPLLGRPDFARAWLQYCRLGAAPAPVLDRDRQTGTEGADARYAITGQSGPRLAAYAYAQTKDSGYAKRAIAELLREGGGIARPVWLRGADVVKPVEEAPGVSTNEAAQTGLQTIELLQFCGDQLPTAAWNFPPRRFRGP